ncbi:hypothetical protein CABS01_09860 [Colletotrichum abscissum]|uniref:uncharacterized protein n=1 Tax=Colletotrichum abscissum TaxID=1671311 RepID=UPI0027D75429|nr:uncharacterized protein CABS01_09860 [Colletotrichum abscissum]KAK1501125.1 hypothetical protein CABS01_09860 [Colletotrichum abscissum]
MEIDSMYFPLERHPVASAKAGRTGIMPIKPPEPKTSTKPVTSVVISGGATVAQASHPSSGAVFERNNRRCPRCVELCENKRRKRKRGGMSPQIKACGL